MTINQKNAMEAINKIMAASSLLAEAGRLIELLRFYNPNEKISDYKLVLETLSSSISYVGAKLNNELKNIIMDGSTKLN